MKKPIQLVVALAMLCCIVSCNSCNQQKLTDVNSSPQVNWKDSVHVGTFAVRQSLDNPGKNVILHLFNTKKQLIDTFVMAPAMAASVLQILGSGPTIYDKKIKYIYRNYPLSEIKNSAQ